MVYGVTEKLQHRQQLAKSYDRSAQVLPELEVGETVRMKPPPGDNTHIWKAGTCLGKVAPRSYLVDVNGSVYRHNRVDLRVAETGAVPGAGFNEFVSPSCSAEESEVRAFPITTDLSRARPTAFIPTLVATSATVGVGEDLGWAPIMAT